MKELLNNCLIALKATIGVATSRPMPRFPEYLEIQKEFPRYKYNSIDDLFSFLKSKITHRALAKESSQTYSTYAFQMQLTQLSLLRVYAALVSFVDDYSGEYPTEYFDETKMQQLILKFKKTPDNHKVNLINQIDFALEITKCEILSALFLIHAVTRLIARGRDFRIFRNGFFISLEERMEIGKKICFFKEEDIGLISDNLGDTYHFWAMFIAGFIYSIVKDQKKFTARIFYFLFKNSSTLMHWVRERLFRSYLYVGAHSEVDRIGFTQGMKFVEII